jgi:hypothetical protein
MENLREECWDFLPVSIMLNRTYKTGGYEQARNANFRQIDQDVSAELLLWTKIFYGYGRTYL